MEEQIEVLCTCSKCGHRYKTKLWRVTSCPPETRDKHTLVEGTEVLCVCPVCGRTYKAQLWKAPNPKEEMNFE